MRDDRSPLIPYPSQLFVPPNPLENPLQLRPTLRIQHNRLRHPSLQMRTKIHMPLTVRRSGPMPHTIRQNRLARIEFGPRQVRMLIHHDPCQMLPRAASHHACLAQLNRESLLQRNRRDPNGKPLNHPRQIFAT